jgi:energy-coupling factor transport system permease protein|tara:strand:- start:269 stop:1168 length:900 start_codon:yes stop_codon:yes gene_type:complete
MPSVPIGAYVPGDSFFHKIHPFVKFYWVLSFVFFCFFNKNPYINYGVALIGIAMVVLAKTFPSYLRTMVVFGPATFAMIFLQSIVPPAVFDNPQYLAELGPFSLYTDSIIYGMLFSSRILCIVTWSILMLMTLHPGELSASLQRAKVPYTVNFMIVTTLQLIPIMQREFAIILSAQKSRAMEAKGFKALLPSIIPVFAGAIDRVQQLSMSLETRAFGSKNERTLLRYKEFSKRDTFLSISALTPVILSMYAKYNLNSFIPSTGFSLSPNVGVFIVAFCGIAFLTIIFGAGFAIRLFGKK